MSVSVQPELVRTRLRTVLRTKVISHMRTLLGADLTVSDAGAYARHS